MASTSTALPSDSDKKPVASLKKRKLRSTPTDTTKRCGWYGCGCGEWMMRVMMRVRVRVRVSEGEGLGFGFRCACG